MKAPAAAMKKPRRASRSSVQRRRRWFWMRVWQSTGSLYGAGDTADGDFARVEASPADDLRPPISAMPALSGGVQYSDKLSDPNRDDTRFLIDHLLSLGETGFLRQPDGKIKERDRKRTCKVCCGLPWHVKGPRCPGCGIAYQETA